MQRCTSRAQRTVCDDVCFCAVHACTGWNGPARHVAGEGRASSAIGGEGERTLSERDMICLLRYRGGCRFDTASSHTCTVHCTLAGILCTSVLMDPLKLCRYRDGRLKDRGLIPAKERDYSLLHNVRLLIVFHSNVRMSVSF
jgi:hypothetical protein